jgi:hypothetical protein
VLHRIVGAVVGVLAVHDPRDLPGGANARRTCTTTNLLALASGAVLAPPAGPTAGAPREGEGGGDPLLPQLGLLGWAVFCACFSELSHSSRRIRDRSARRGACIRERDSFVVARSSGGLPPACSFSPAHARSPVDRRARPVIALYGLL